MGFLPPSVSHARLYENTNDKNNIDDDDIVVGFSVYYSEGRREATVGPTPQMYIIHAATAAVIVLSLECIPKPRIV